MLRGVNWASKPFFNESSMPLKDRNFPWCRQTIKQSWKFLKFDFCVCDWFIYCSSTFYLIESTSVVHSKYFRESRMHQRLVKHNFMRQLVSLNINHLLCEIKMWDFHDVQCTKFTEINDNISCHATNINRNILSDWSMIVLVFISE